MPQFDFFIIAKVSILFFAAFFLISFVLALSNIITAWVGGACKLLYKADLNSSSWSTRNINLLGAVVMYSDLMEQFLVIGGLCVGFLILILLLLSTFAALEFFVPFCVLQLTTFVGSLIKDLSQAEAPYFARSWINLSTIFMSILLSNLLGIIPNSYTFTSGLAVPFFFSTAVLIIYVITLLKRFRLTVFAGFLPAGTSVFIAPLIILIEIISTLAKFLSLGIRLFANMFAGHLLLKVFYSICFQVIVYVSAVASLSQLLVITFLLFVASLELMIAALQAFVLLLLVIIYLREAESFILNH
jgi:ATP synthase subunit 6